MRGDPKKRLCAGTGRFLVQGGHATLPFHGVALTRQLALPAKHFTICRLDIPGFRRLADFHSYDPAKGHGLPHDPLKAIIAPRPIGWIATRSASGVDNLAPYSFFNMVSNRPPLVAFASEGKKDTLSNILATGGFVHNLASRRQVEAMSQSSAQYASQVDEFTAVGLGKLAAERVDAAIVAGTPAALECRLVQTVALVGLDAVESGTTLVIGEIVRVHIDTAYLVDGLFDAVAAQTIARCGYRNAYAGIDSIFSLPGPVR